MYIISISGSPRHGSNTDILIEEAIAGALQANPDCQVERLRVDDCGVKPCTGTLSCRKEGRCIQDDGMRGVLEKIQSADGLIIGSPIYRGYLSGQMKVFMDRTTPLERDRKPGEEGSMKAAGVLFRILPRSMQQALLDAMFKKVACSYYRLPKPIDSVVIATGGHPDIALVRDQMNRALKELGFFSLASGGSVVAAVRCAGVLEAGRAARNADARFRARAAGARLAEGIRARGAA